MLLYIVTSLTLSQCFYLYVMHALAISLFQTFLFCLFMFLSHPLSSSVCLSILFSLSVTQLQFLKFRLEVQNSLGWFHSAAAGTNPQIISFLMGFLIHFFWLWRSRMSYCSSLGSVPQNFYRKLRLSSCKIRHWRENNHPKVWLNYYKSWNY